MHAIDIDFLYAQYFCPNYYQCNYGMSYLSAMEFYTVLILIKKPTSQLKNYGKGLLLIVSTNLTLFLDILK